eukprot:CAMPEP_0201515796 /NCGR_PEP_ID=MMETSP0161_2-20130828/7267_1 /ASSEMBLY_ACC=CAM_ASM_000251 /TAXON_ID=180227 /ORGANISM="Neoparamoeba aestuarina, Strain SoJaBio B1-5/56/2" /LENGTH=709 /DNA_ID=CAMNT_0047912719 /DNA_START=1 /DNA_END=2130 /DNA_ORIENTATION=+
MEKRFPISEENVRVNFSWTDSFPGNRSAFLSLITDKISSYSTVYEKGAILFNLATAFANLGAAVDRNQPDGVKYACAHFQHASGVFNLTKELMERHPTQVKTIDMDPVYLETLSVAMLGQAQECFYEKAIADKMKDSTLTKLASQIADFYGRAYTLIQTPKLYNFPRAVELGAHFELRRRLFMAGAHYRFSAALKAQIKYGEQVAHLRIASGLLSDQKNKPFLKLVSPEFQEKFTVNDTQLQQILAIAAKDNDKIYYQPVPANAPVDLPRHQMVHSKVPEKLGSIDGSDPFAKIVPFDVQVAVGRYKERKDGLHRVLTDLIEEHNNMAKGSLTSMGLPGSLLAHESSTWPEDVSKKIRSLQDHGGVDTLLKSFAEINEKQNTCRQMCENALKSLDMEEADDQRQRELCGSSWKRTPSHMLTEKMREEGAKYRGNLEHSTKSDAFVKRQFTENEKMLFQLSGSQEMVDKLLPPPKKMLTNMPIMDTLRNLLQKLDQIIAERLKMRAQLNENPDVTEAFVHATKSFDELIAERLKPYEDIKIELEKNTAIQEDLLNQISNANNEYTTFLRSQNMEADNERAVVCQTVNVALMVYLELVGNLSEGKRFYNELHVLVDGFQRKCNDFCVARAIERDSLLKDIMENQQRQQQQQQQQQQQYQAPPPSYSTTATHAPAPSPSPYGNYPPPQGHAPPPQGGYYQGAPPASAPGGWR